MRTPNTPDEESEDRKKRSERFTHVEFHRFKTFRSFGISLSDFNVLVGPNNCGKSTVLGAFRILSEGLRKARSRNPSWVQGPNGEVLGYVVDLQNVPVATENVFHNYDDSRPASIRFRISNGNELLLFFPEVGRCCLICLKTRRPISSTASFRNAYPISIGFVPILGPVEHNERLYQKEAARLALLTHAAARNFRNIWYHYPGEFDQFRQMVMSTWQGMDIGRPEVDISEHPALLRMFCEEEGIPREIFWAGFGFQVWCQMLTYLVTAASDSLFVVDEPDIYLHADLQRQLVGILKSLGPDVLIATHSTEIIAEADLDELVYINKKSRTGKRIREPGELQYIFKSLGSTLNPTLTQLAKTKRALFVEGDDFQLISRFARKLGFDQVGSRSDFVVIPARGFNPGKVRDFVEGMERTLGSRVLVAVVFDRDYRPDAECEQERRELERYCRFAHIHSRKELENFLLVPSVLTRAVKARIADRNRRSNAPCVSFGEDMTAVLLRLTEAFRRRVEAQYLERQRPYEKRKNPKLDETTISERLIEEFEGKWRSPSDRWLLLPGKETIAALNQYLQRSYCVTLTAAHIISSFNEDEIPSEMRGLIQQIDIFRQEEVQEGVLDDTEGP